MTSVNESNAYQRGHIEGRKKGFSEGMKAGRIEMRDDAVAHGTSLRLWKLAIAWLVGFMCAVALEAHAQPSAETTVTVVIEEEISSSNNEHTQVSASVPCNDQNCPETAQPETSWWQRLVQWTREIFTTE